MFERALIAALKRLPQPLLQRLAGPPNVIDGRRLDPMLQILWKQGQKLKPMHEMSDDEARAVFNASLPLTDAPATPLKRVEDRTIPSPAGPIPVRIYTRRNLPENPAFLLWFHQGGYVLGDLESPHSFCTFLADKADCIVINVNYRHAPEHKFPAPVDEAVAAYEWLLNNAHELVPGITQPRIAVGGDSAGGQLAALICHHAKKNDLPQPILQLLVYPWLTAVADTPSYTSCADAWPLNTKLMRWFLDHYLPNPHSSSSSKKPDLTDPTDPPTPNPTLTNPQLSPLHQPDFTHLAPALIYSAGFDPLRDEAHLYAQKLADANVPTTYHCFDSLTHSFTTLRGASKAAQGACDKIAEALRNRV